MTGPPIGQILAALLHMGNIKYKGKVVDNLDATDIPDTSNVERVAAIMGVQKQSLGRVHARDSGIPIG